MNANARKWNAGSADSARPFADFGSVVGNLDAAKKIGVCSVDIITHILLRYLILDITLYTS